MYSVYAIINANPTNSANPTNLIKTNRFFTTNDEIYQVLRDVDFMVKVNKPSQNQIIQIRLIKTIQNTEQIIGDFYFELIPELFDENLKPFPRLTSIVVNEKQYVMNVSLSHYKSIDFDGNEFFITHPSFTIKNIK